MRKFFKDITSEENEYNENVVSIIRNKFPELNLSIIEYIINIYNISIDIFILSTPFKKSVTSIKWKCLEQKER